MYIDLLEFQFEIDDNRNKSVDRKKRFIVSHLCKCLKYETEVSGNRGPIFEIGVLIEIYKGILTILANGTYNDIQLKRGYYSKHVQTKDKSELADYLADKYSNHITYLFHELALTESELMLFNMELKMYLLSCIDCYSHQLNELKFSF